MKNPNYENEFMRRRLRYLAWRNECWRRDIAQQIDDLNRRTGAEWYDAGDGTLRRRDIPLT